LIYVKKYKYTRSMKKPDLKNIHFAIIASAFALTATLGISRLTNSTTGDLTQTDLSMAAGTPIPGASATPYPSTPRPVSTATPPAGAFVGTTPIADSEVKKSYPYKNYGTLLSIQVDKDSSGSNHEAYFKFDLGTSPYRLPTKYTQARLRLYVTNASTNGPLVYKVSNNYLNTTTPWNETGLTWNNKPSKTGSVLSNLGAMTVGTHVYYDVTSALNDNQYPTRVYSFGMFADSTDGAQFASREAANGTQPLLEYYYIPQ
jgi:hypothetical protein